MSQLMLSRPATPAEVVLDEAAARRTLRKQVARLERELSTLFGSVYPRSGFEWQVNAHGGPRLLSLAELEQLRDDLADRVEQARDELRKRNEVELANARLIDRMIADPRAHKWLQVSADHLGQRGCKHWHSRPRFGIIGMMLGWWRVRISSGCPLAQG